MIESVKNLSYITGKIWKGLTTQKKFNFLTKLNACHFGPRTSLSRHLSPEWNVCLINFGWMSSSSELLYPNLGLRGTSAWALLPYLTRAGGIRWSSYNSTCIDFRNHSVMIRVLFLESIKAVCPLLSVCARAKITNSTRCLEALREWSTI